MSGGRLCRWLATLPYRLFTSEATVELDERAADLTVTPEWKTKEHRAALLTASDLGIPPLRGVLPVESNIEVSLGFGSSASAVAASVRAVLYAFGGERDHARVARPAVQAKSAAIPSCSTRWCSSFHREGRLIESLRAALRRPRGRGPRRGHRRTADRAQRQYRSFPLRPCRSGPRTSRRPCREGAEREPHR
ncbi:hypothetical protein [Streptomyces sp. NPDC002566]|uniref:GHMP family kinase ATP-binding protein n=1 Tax=Streptomyces sp. NPDC002566 TaxID=3364650 RepID=UPI00369D8070